MATRVGPTTFLHGSIESAIPENPPVETPSLGAEINRLSAVHNRVSHGKVPHINSGTHFCCDGRMGLANSSHLDKSFQPSACSAFDNAVAFILHCSEQAVAAA